MKPVDIKTQTILLNNYRMANHSQLIPRSTLLSDLKQLHIYYPDRLIPELVKFGVISEVIDEKRRKSYILPETPILITIVAKSIEVIKIKAKFHQQKWYEKKKLEESNKGKDKVENTQSENVQLESDQSENVPDYITDYDYDNLQKSIYTLDCINFLELFGYKCIKPKTLFGKVILSLIKYL